MTGFIFVNEVFQLGSAGFLGFLGLLLEKRSLLTVTKSFLFGHDPWNIADVVFLGFGLDNSNTVFISRQRLNLIASCCIWTAVACAEAAYYKFGQTLIRLFRAPVLLVCRRPRLLWFPYIFIVQAVYRGLFVPLTAGHAKGHTVVAPLIQLLGDRIAALLLSIRPYLRRVHSQSGLNARGCHFNRYRYQTLPGTRNIRLLRLAPYSPCELVSADVDQAPVFVAISYRWGKEPTDHALLLKGGQQIAIQRNVYQILQSIAPLQGCLHVWIDSICIDQESKDEKVAQIPLMGAIYRNADRVIACLPGIAHSQLLASDVHTLCGVYKRTGDIIAIRQGLYVTGRQDHWNAVKSVMQNPYWERLWIIQELVLAKQLFILAGDCVLEWEAIVDLAEEQGPSFQRQWEFGPGNTFEWTVMPAIVSGSAFVRMLSKLRASIPRAIEPRTTSGTCYPSLGCPKRPWTWTNCTAFSVSVSRPTTHWCDQIMRSALPGPIKMSPFCASVKDL